MYVLIWENLQNSWSLFLVWLIGIHGAILYLPIKKQTNHVADLYEFYWVITLSYIGHWTVQS